MTVAPAGALVYYPILPKAGQPFRGVFAEGERYEHQQGGCGEGDRLVSRSLARSEDPAFARALSCGWAAISERPDRLTPH